MPPLFLYLAKLSICLAAMYLFYRLLLHRLTFYNLNRWYLLGYSFLSFFIPLINISPLVEERKLSAFTLVRVVPVINDLDNKNTVAASPAFSWGVWDILLLIVITGTAVMFARFMLQWISYANIKRHAQLLSNNHFRVYSVDKNIIPFSFGRSVFINPALHHPDELQEILQHEYVHIQQQHTIDIVWTEIFCLFNWYNPFAWLIRHSIRQNLEFIADDKVVENGIEKKRYQYLLLKVMDIPQYPLAASFNFSSLKKRIHMMNKMKSAKLHLVNFLFLLPLLAVLLLAFRITANKSDWYSQNQGVTISGIVVETGNYKLLGDVHVEEVYSGTQVTTDEEGYYSFTLPVTGLLQKSKIIFRKEGYKDVESLSEANYKEISNKENRAELSLARMIGMVPGKTDGNTMGSFVHGILLPDKTGKQSNYELVVKAFEDMKQFSQRVALLQKQSAGSEKPYWVMNGHTYLIHAHGGLASVETVTDVIMVDGKKMTGKEVNEKYTRSMIRTVGAMNKEIAQKKYGIDQDVMEIYTTDKIPGDTLSRKPAR